MPRNPGRLSVLVWLVLLCLASHAGAEVIRSFDTDLRLQPDSSLDVSEVIVMDFGGAERHGIYRQIPVRYTRYNSPYSIWLKLLSVTDEGGKPLRYSTARLGAELNIRIGDPDVTVRGVHTYRLHYEVHRAVNFFNGAPEVYWNATGNVWPFRIAVARAHLHAPPGTAIEAVQSGSYVGPPGSRHPGTITRTDEEILYQWQNLSPGEGLTIVAGLPAGSVKPPSMLQEAWWWVSDWWPALVFPLLALGVVGLQWMRAGRDADRGQAIAVEWNPPKDLSPAEVGTLIDERCDMPDIVSTLIDLAARGYLTIKETASPQFFFFSNRDYQFVKRDPPPNAAPLLPHEQRFLSGLFGASNVRSLSDLKDRFYTHLPAIRDAIYDSLTGKGFFTANPQTVRTTYRSMGIVLLLLCVGVSVWGWSHGNLSYGLGLALSAVVVIGFARAMPAKTLVGSHTLRECLGFRRFLSLVEKDRIASIAKDDPTIFGRLLPYAMVLGVADQWANAFRDLLHQPPDWYVPIGAGRGFHPDLFVHDLGGGMRTMSRAFTSTPSRSGSGAGGGFSGFSSGGGFSGGGFGGGGGGSW